MAEATSVEEVLDKANELLAAATAGIGSVTSGDPTQRRAGILNVATFARSVTLVLQNLRSVVGKEAFDAWYMPHLEMMKATEPFDFFRDLRNEILKEGPPRTASETHGGSIDLEKIERLQPKAIQVPQASSLATTWAEVAGRFRCQMVRRSGSIRHSLGTSPRSPSICQTAPCRLHR